MATATNLSINSAMFASVGDPEGTRTVTSIIALLVALGLALAMIAVWTYRTTRPDPDLLAPLEVMGERKWRRADPVAQRRGLDALRPLGATPLAPSVAPPDIDEAFDLGPSASGFEDLSGDHPDLGEREPLPPMPVLAPPDGTPTPQELDRPAFDDFDGHEIDPALLAAAAAELDAELQVKPDTE